MTSAILSDKLPGMWEDLPLRTYLGEVKRRHGVVDTLALPNMRDLPPIRVERLFVQPLLARTPVDASGDPNTWPKGDGLFTAFQSTPRIVVLGDPGSGKTTLTKWLTWRLCTGLVAPLPPALEGRIPIPCVLREMKSDLFQPATSIADLAISIADRLLGERADSELKASLRARIEAKQYVLILDGIDEIPMPQRKIVASWMRTAAADGASALATARVVGYDDCRVDGSSPTTRDRNRRQFPSLTIAVGHFVEKIVDQDTKWAQTRFLMPFDQKRIAAFVQNWYLQRSGSEDEAKSRANDLMHALSQSAMTRELARTPNLLSLMAIIHRERAHLPDGKALLYKEIANAYINTIDQHRKIALDDALAPYGWEAREGWLALVGFQMQLERSSATDGNSQSGILFDKAKVIGWLESAMAASNVPRTRLNAEEFLKWVARRNGLLLPRGEERFAFVHPSFQEYFCARYVASRIVSPAFLVNKGGSAALVTRESLRDWSEKQIWHEILIYMLELISGERDPEWVEYIADVLFGAIDEEGDFTHERAKFAARALGDRHINLSRQRKAMLAERSADAAILEWENAWGTGETPVLRAMSGTEHAVISTAEPSEINSALKSSAIDKINNTETNETGFLLFIATGEQVPGILQIQKMRNLRLLSIENSFITDISGIKELTQLRHINLARSPVQNISALKKLNKVRYLNLSDTEVTDISALKGMKNLRHLDLSRTQVVDLTPLAGLKNLRILDIQGSRIKDTSVLDGLSDLFIFK